MSIMSRGFRGARSFISTLPKFKRQEDVSQFGLRPVVERERSSLRCFLSHPELADDVLNPGFISQCLSRKSEVMERFPGLVTPRFVPAS